VGRGNGAYFGKEESKKTCDKYFYERLKLTELKMHDDCMGIFEGGGFLVGEDGV